MTVGVVLELRTRQPLARATSRAMLERTLPHRHPSSPSKVPPFQQMTNFDDGTQRGSHHDPNLRDGFGGTRPRDSRSSRQLDRQSAMITSFESAL